MATPATEDDEEAGESANPDVVVLQDCPTDTQEGDAEIDKRLEILQDDDDFAEGGGDATIPDAEKLDKRE